MAPASPQFSLWTCQVEVSTFPAHTDGAKTARIEIIENRIQVCWKWGMKSDPVPVKVRQGGTRFALPAASLVPNPPRHWQPIGNPLALTSLFLALTNWIGNWELQHACSNTEHGEPQRHRLPVRPPCGPLGKVPGNTPERCSILPRPVSFSLVMRNRQSLTGECAKWTPFCVTPQQC